MYGKIRIFKYLEMIFINDSIYNNLNGKLKGLLNKNNYFLNLIL